MGGGVCGPLHTKSRRAQAGGGLLLLETYDPLFSPEKRLGRSRAAKEGEKRQAKTFKGLRKVGAMLGNLLHLCASLLRQGMTPKAWMRRNLNNAAKKGQKRLDEEHKRQLCTLRWHRHAGRWGQMY